MEIEFRTGLYQYEDIPEYVYYDLMDADWKGCFFHENIEGVYSYYRSG